ncbi:MAG: YggT family protein [Elainella sp. Prado103]|nr:YggT family protein [Elainella sp. Prado103]
MSMIADSLSVFLQIYSVLLIIRILLSWFPNLNPYEPPLSILTQITDPYLNIFRSFIPPLGGIDFSPMLAIFALQIVSSLFSSAVQAATFSY